MEETMDIVIGVSLWLGFSIWVAVAAYKKDRSIPGYLILSLLISPIIAGAIVYALDPNEGMVFKQCPVCGEFIYREATICRYCGSHFETTKE